MINHKTPIEYRPSISPGPRSVHPQFRNPRRRIPVAVAVGIPGPLRHLSTIGDDQGQGTGGVHAQVVHGLAG